MSLLHAVAQCGTDTESLLPSGFFLDIGQRDRKSRGYNIDQVPTDQVVSGTDMWNKRLCVC
eukprot:1884346-Rhodomonas_salina.2